MVPGCFHLLDDVLHRTAVVTIVSGGTRECPGIGVGTRVGVRGAVQVQGAWTRAGAAGSMRITIPAHGVSGDRTIRVA